MLFITVRLIFWSIVFVACFIYIKRSHIIRKRQWYLISFIIVTILTTLSALVPIENAFITFPSLESAYSYTHLEEAKLIVNGNKTDFVIGQKGDTYTYTIIPKSDKGWKLTRGTDIKQTNNIVHEGYIIYVYQYKNSDDYYITVLDTKGGESKITDNHNSKFYYLNKTNSTLNQTFYTYYAYINNLDDQYTIEINDLKIKVKN